MNKQVFCARKGGATMDAKFYPLRTSDILERQLARKAAKVEARLRRSGADYRF